MNYFPQIYEDELLYSAFARYHIRSGNVSIKATLEDLFEKTSASATIDLPCNISALINRMPVGTNLTEKKLVFNNTLFPYYTAFLPSERKQEVYRSMLSSNGGGIHTKIGIMASSVTSKPFLQFCPKCFFEDKKKYGESYWHREHQVPGCYVCSEHSVPLQDSLMSLNTKSKHEYVPASNDNCIIRELGTLNKHKNVMFQTISDKTYKGLLRIAAYTKNLLEQEYESKPMGWFADLYTEKLKSMELANSNGVIRWGSLSDAFISHFEHEFLQIVQSTVNVESESTWLKMILRKNRKSFHPLRHLLVIDFLGLTLEDVFGIEYKYEPFGIGPWLCLNAGANHYMKPVVSDLKITYCNDNKSPVATFACDCGFVYKRSGPDTCQSDKFRISRMVQYGKVWEEKLKELVRMGLGLRETARKLNVDVNTVKKYAKKLGLQVQWGALNDNSEQVTDIPDTFIENQTDFRIEWLGLRKQYPDKTKTELRMLRKALYTWLYRNDKEWLDENSPKMKMRKTINSRVNWKNRDEEIFELVKSETEKMLGSGGKPVRITISRIGKRIGMLALLEKHLDKLPKTKSYLELATESVESFQVRRIEWAIEELRKEGQELFDWRIKRKAGIRKEFEIINRHIIKSMKSYNTGI